MQKIKSFLGYSFAVLTLPLVLAVFMGNLSAAQALVSATGVRVTPWSSGGEVVYTVDHTGYQTLIREAVFQALIGERREGFVQIDWVPDSLSPSSLPGVIDEEIDYDGDGLLDFRITLETQASQVSLTPYDDHVLRIEPATRLKDRWVVRVDLKNKK